MALSVTPAEAILADQARTEIKQLHVEGAHNGTTFTTPGIGLSNEQYEQGVGLDYVESIALAVIRRPLPTYSLATLPAAAGRAGMMVYVPDGAEGQPVVAFSDGSSWLRCDTRMTVSPGIW